MKILIFLTLVTLFALLSTGCARVVTSGSHNLQSGTILPGSLIITSGQLLIEEESRVSGSILMTSGDLVIQGEVEGNIFMASGKIYVGPEAVVHGRIRSSSGSVRQAEGARVLGGVSTDVNDFDLGKFLALIGVAFYFLATAGRRFVTRQKEPAGWAEKPGKESGYV